MCNQLFNQIYSYLFSTLVSCSGVQEQEAGITLIERCIHEVHHRCQRLSWYKTHVHHLYWPVH